MKKIYVTLDFELNGSEWNHNSKVVSKYHFPQKGIGTQVSLTHFLHDGEQESAQIMMGIRDNRKTSTSGYDKIIGTRTALPQ